MAQFDVHRNPGRNPDVPYVVVVQTRYLDDLPTRLAVPLIRASALGRVSRDAAPTLDVLGVQVVAATWQMQTLPRRTLGAVVATLSDDAAANSIIRAIDFVVTRSYG